MKKPLASLAVLALLVLAPAGASASALYPIPPAVPATPAAAAHASASDVANELSGATPAALGKGFQLHAAASGPGTISIVLSAKIHGKTVVIGTGHKTAGAAGSLDVALQLTRAGKSALAGHKGQLKITVLVVFHPQHGAKKSASAKVALK
jgi:hypothetical protein